MQHQLWCANVSSSACCGEGEQYPLESAELGGKHFSGAVLQLLCAGFPLQSTDTISCSGDHGQKQRNAFVHYYRSFRALSRQHSLSDAHVSKPENTPLTQPCRQCQTNSSISAVPADEWNLEYTGVVSSTVRTLKLVSIGTATLSLVGSSLYIMATMDGQYTAVKVMAASGFTCFGLFTTGMIQNVQGLAVCRA